MQEKHVGYCDGCDGLGRTSTEPHEDAGSQEACERLVKDGPDSAREVYGVADDIDWPPPVLVGNGHPEEVADALEQCRCGEKVGNLGNVVVEAHWIDGRRRIGKEIQRCLHNGNGGTGCQKVAPKHGHTNDCGNGFLVPSWPGDQISNTIPAREPTTSNSEENQRGSTSTYQLRGSLGSLDGVGIRMISLVSWCRSRTFPSL